MGNREYLGDSFNKVLRVDLFTLRKIEIIMKGSYPIIIIIFFIILIINNLFFY